MIKTALAFIAGGMLSAGLSPLVYWGLQAFSEALPFLRVVPFHRVWSRISMICAVVMLLVSVKVSHFERLFLQSNKYLWCDISWGVFSGVMPMALLTVAYVHFNVCRVQGSIELLPFLTIIGRAIGTAIFEETLFRGLFYGLGRKPMGTTMSAVLSSGIFATLHFISSASEFTHVVDIWSGWREFGCLFTSIPPWPTFLFAWIHLISVGLLLCWLVEQTSSLALPIGLHIGWVLVIQIGNLFIKFQMVAPGNLPWVGPHAVSGSLPIGIFATFSICLTALFCWKYLKMRNTWS